MATKKKYAPKFSTFNLFLANFRKTVQEKLRLNPNTAGQQSVS